METDEDGTEAGGKANEFQKHITGNGPYSLDPLLQTLPRLV
ncbi:unnamed protein product [Acanthoscelides obtectus]|uniref:Uncharacterized protein n=1 Tax=Acanthoscelides obtectus TaxID=200917 RepID=A0A9P0MA37_ACAOB|nr:unnamed protein product [Acanthoscelides obtectus]CAK1650038.1 hypothetical protein AOBTE_LOCUS16562 [Acanthoscelides obtectus]